MRRTLFLSLVLGGAAVPLPGHAAPEAKAASPGDAGKHAVKDRILGALDLPLKAQALRKAGADEPAVKAGLKAAKAGRLDGKEAADLLDAAATATREHGPVDNFGAFVQMQLDAGLRGKDLAAAIRTEHAARGKGHGRGKQTDGKGPPDGKGKPDDVGGADGKPDDVGGAEGKGPPDGKGKPDDVGGAEGKGPPDSKGKPDDVGGAEGKGPPDGKGKPDDVGGADENGAAQGKGKGKNK